MIEIRCGEARDLLHLHTDGELVQEESVAMTAHIANCDRCRNDLESIETLRSRIRAAGPHALPVGLERRVVDALDAENRRIFGASAPPLWRRYAGMAASYTLVAALSAGLVYGVMTSSRSNEHLVRDIVSAHVRAGLNNQLVQVASNDTHTVKPWLAARLPYSPEVKDFKADGFPLIGGRVEYLLDRAVASLIYTRRQHAITVFVLPAEAKAAAALKADRNGYHVASWRDGSAIVIAISDLNQPEFDEFIKLARGNNRS